METRSTMTMQANGDQVEFGTISFEGKEVTALGSIVSADGQYVTGYYKGEEVIKRNTSNERGMITTWDGKPLGIANVVSKWRIQSYISSHMLQVAANINGVWYTGRTAGSGMIWRGKRMAKQRGGKSID